MAKREPTDKEILNKREEELGNLKVKLKSLEKTIKSLDTDKKIAKRALEENEEAMEVYKDIYSAVVGFLNPLIPDTFIKLPEIEEACDLIFDKGSKAKSTLLSKINKAIGDNNPLSLYFRSAIAAEQEFEKLLAEYEVIRESINTITTIVSNPNFIDTETREKIQKFMNENKYGPLENLSQTKNTKIIAEVAAKYIEEIGMKVTTYANTAVESKQKIEDVIALFEQLPSFAYEKERLTAETEENLAEENKEQSIEKYDWEIKRKSLKNIIEHYKELDDLLNLIPEFKKCNSLQERIHFYEKIPEILHENSELRKTLEDSTNEIKLTLDNHLTALERIKGLSIDEIEKRLSTAYIDYEFDEDAANDIKYLISNSKEIIETEDLEAVKSKLSHDKSKELIDIFLKYRKDQEEKTDKQLNDFTDDQEELEEKKQKRLKEKFDSLIRELRKKTGSNDIKFYFNVKEMKKTKQVKDILKEYKSNNPLIDVHLDSRISQTIHLHNRRRYESNVIRAIEDIYYLTSPKILEQLKQGSLEEVCSKLNYSQFRQAAQNIADSYTSLVDNKEFESKIKEVREQLEKAEAELAKYNGVTPEQVLEYKEKAEEIETILKKYKASLEKFRQKFHQELAKKEEGHKEIQDKYNRLIELAGKRERTLEKLKKELNSIESEFGPEIYRYFAGINKELESDLSEERISKAGLLYDIAKALKKADTKIKNLESQLAQAKQEKVPDDYHDIKRQLAEAQAKLDAYDGKTPDDVIALEQCVEAKKDVIEDLNRKVTEANQKAEEKVTKAYEERDQAITDKNRAYESIEKLTAEISKEQENINKLQNDYTVLEAQLGAIKKKDGSDSDEYVKLQKQYSQTQSDLAYAKQLLRKDLDVIEEQNKVIKKFEQYDAQRDAKLDKAEQLLRKDLDVIEEQTRVMGKYIKDSNNGGIQNE